MPSFTIYHNPRCSKSRQTLALLEERGIIPEVVEYLNEPPSAETLKNLLSLLNLGARDVMRTKEAAYSNLGLAQEDNEDRLIAAMVEHPILIERPIVVSQHGDQERATIGRPPENVLELLE